MMILPVDKTTLAQAAFIHSVSWTESHRSICGEAFLKIHTPRHQEEYLAGELRTGKRLFMLVTEKPVGIVSVAGSLIENLYVLPAEQGKGYGTELLRFAVGQCGGTPRLWILETNQRAYSLYAKNGFCLTGNRHPLSETLSEVEMAQEADSCARHPAKLP